MSHFIKFDAAKLQLLIQIKKYFMQKIANDLLKNINQ